MCIYLANQHIVFLLQSFVMCFTIFLQPILTNLQYTSCFIIRAVTSHFTDKDATFVQLASLFVKSDFLWSY